MYHSPLIFYIIVVLFLVVLPLWGFALEKQEKKEEARRQQSDKEAMLRQREKDELTREKARQEFANSNLKRPWEMTPDEHRAWFRSVIEEANRKHPLPPVYWEWLAEKQQKALSKTMDEPEPPGSGFVF